MRRRQRSSKAAIAATSVMPRTSPSTGCSCRTAPCAQTRSGEIDVTTRSLVVGVMLVCLPTAAAAQNTVSDVVAFLVTNQAVATANPDRDRAAADAARDVISRALLVNLASMPLATSSGGFVYRLNPHIGTAERTTRSFGAFFVDRALTAGRDHASFGVVFSESSFDRLDGRSMTDGTLITTANRFRDEAAPFDVESLTLDIHSSTMTIVSALGITDRLEVGAAVPLVRLSVEGQRVNLYRGATFVQASATASASGVGDVAIRAK